MSKQYQQQQ